PGRNALDGRPVWRSSHPNPDSPARHLGYGRAGRTILASAAVHDRQGGLRIRRSAQRRRGARAVRFRVFVLLSEVRSGFALLAVMLLLSVGASADQNRHEGSLAIVVGRGSFIETITKDELREIYLRRQRIWSNGKRLIPINLPPSNPVRERFSSAVLGRGTQDLLEYWNARYFEGITPPVVLPSPAAVVAYLASEPGAIAYLPPPEVNQ